MNVFDAFEDKVSRLFGDVNNAQVPPVSFKKIAQNAVKKMKEYAVEVDGTPVAPVLYTILISSGDDAIMRPMYGTLCEETADFLKKKAREKGYYLSGKPLVRFMVDPSLKKGKFAVFAETVDSQRLEELRAEEHAFLNNSSFLGGAAQNAFQVNKDEYEDDDAGLGFVPEDLPSSYAKPAQPKHYTSTPLVSTLPAPTPNVQPEAALATPPTQKRAVATAQVPSRAMSAKPAESTIMLIDRSTGRTYTATETTVIGRQRQGDNIVLNDTNVSRRHAQISHKGQNWYLEDLGSTNGCQVNGEDVDVAKLKTGDRITVGITTLEVRID